MCVVQYFFLILHAQMHTVPQIPPAGGVKQKIKMVIALFIFLALNVLTFAVYGLDKWKARHARRRISEAALLTWAAVGGAVGAWIGMKVWHHKTLHWKFRLGVPFLTLVWLFVWILLGGAAFLLDYSLRPGGRAERDAASMEYLAAYPGMPEWTDSMRREGALRDTFIIGERGLRLHALYAPCHEAQGTAILVHGYTDNALRMLMLGRFYHQAMHYNILLPDHAAHGQSEGDAIQMGWLDRLNVERWIGVADSLWHANGKTRGGIYLHGISMGAATVMMCSGDQLPTSVKGIIEDCGYTSVWDEFACQINDQFHLPVHPLMDVASLMCRLRYGWGFREASALEQVRRSTLPMLFIHGDNDSYVPTHMVHPLYEAKKTGYRQQWIARGSAHAKAYMDHPREYEQEVKEFIHYTQTDTVSTTSIEP